MTPASIVFAVLALSLGLFGGYLFFRSRLDLVRREIRSEMQGQLAAAEARIIHLETELEKAASAQREGQAGLERIQADLGQRDRELARNQALLEAEQIKTADLQNRLSTAEVKAVAVGTELKGADEAMGLLKVQAAEAAATAAAVVQEREKLIAETEERSRALNQAQADILAKSEAVASLTKQLEGFQLAADARMEALQAAHAKLSETFQALSADALKANSESFLQLAQTQMQGAQALSAQDLEARGQAIASLVAPVQTTMAAMQESVQKLAIDRATAEASLGTHIQNLVQAQQGLQSETAKLANALGKPEVRGQWGEQQLRNVVEYAGMMEHVDFEVQSTLEVDDQKRRPDMLVRIPGGKRIAVDAKTTARAYLEAVAETGAAREQRLKDVARQVRVQVENLGQKGYYSGLVESPDFVVLFLPLEALFSLALEQDPDLLEFAARRNVVPASPTTLLALLKAVAYGWAQERIQANAEEIQTLGGELVKRLSDMASHTQDLRKALEDSVKAFNAFAGSLESRVMVTSQRLLSLGIQPSLKGKRKILQTRAPQILHAELSGLPKLGVAGSAPVMDVEPMDLSDQDVEEVAPARAQASPFPNTPEPNLVENDPTEHSGWDPPPVPLPSSGVDGIFESRIGTAKSGLASPTKPSASFPEAKG